MTTVIITVKALYSLILLKVVSTAPMFSKCASDLTSMKPLFPNMYPANLPSEDLTGEAMELLKWIQVTKNDAQTLMDSYSKRAGIDEMTLKKEVGRLDHLPWVENVANLDGLTSEEWSSIAGTLELFRCALKEMSSTLTEAEDEALANRVNQLVPHFNELLFSMYKVIYSLGFNPQMDLTMRNLAWKPYSERRGIQSLIDFATLSRLFSYLSQLESSFKPYISMKKSDDLMFL